MRGTLNSLKGFGVVCCVCGWMGPFTSCILRRSGLPLSRYPGDLSTRMLWGDRCNCWPKGFTIYPAMPPDPGLWLSRIPTHTESSIRGKGMDVTEEADQSSFLSPEAESVLEWCLEFSQSAPGAPPTYLGRQEGHGSHRVWANLIAQEFYTDLLRLSISGMKAILSAGAEPSHVWAWKFKNKAEWGEPALLNSPMGLPALYSVLHTFSFSPHHNPPGIITFPYDKMKAQEG